MIKKALEITEPEKKQHMVNSIANFMKMAYVLWNKDHVADDQLLSDLREMSNGELDLSEVVLNKVEVKQQNNNNNTPSRTQKTNNRGTNGRQNNNNNKGRQKNYSNNGGGRKSN